MIECSFYGLEVKICVRKCCVCGRRSCHKGNCWTPYSSSVLQKEVKMQPLCRVEWFPVQGVGFNSCWKCKKSINTGLISMLTRVPPDLCPRPKLSVFNVAYSLVSKRGCHSAPLLVVSLLCSKKYLSSKNVISVQKTAQESKILFGVRGWNLKTNVNVCLQM